MDLTTPAIIGDIVGSYYLKNEGEFYDLEDRIKKGIYFRSHHNDCCPE